jgi:pyrroloquinoline quinone (PQQ) biosynthesis protein C
MLDLQEVLRPGAPTATIGKFLDELEDLGRRGHAGDKEAYAAYQGTMFALHTNRDPATYTTRAWLASRMYPLEEEQIERVQLPEKLSWDDFVDRAKNEGSSKQRIAHPMSRHLFEGDPSLGAVRVYLHHHWHRTKDFYQRLAELAVRLEMDDAAVVYENVAEEVGVGDAPAHPPLLQALLAHLDIPCDVTDEPTHPAAHAYLNEWFRACRAPRLEWGLGFVFSIEWGVPQVHGRIHALLERKGIPEEHRKFHWMHSTLDLEHSDEILEVAERLITTKEGQEMFLSELRHRKQVLGPPYFDSIWEEMQAA